MNTEIIDRIIIGRVEPHIYAFETNTVPNYLKIGDTYRPVEERLKEWRRHFTDLVKLYEHEARIDERYFRDLEVHKFVEREKSRSRITREKYPNLPYFSNEFFENAIPEDIDEAIDDIKKSAAENDGRYQFYSMNRIREDFHFTRDEKPLPLRPNQEETVRRFKEAVNNKRTHLLMYAVMRFGKTFTSLCCAQQIENLKLVLVVSAKAGVISEWQKNVEKCKNFEEFQFVTSKQLKRNHNLVKDAFQNKQKIVVCLTLQDLNNPEIKEHHKQLFEEDIDLLIVDETHYGARAEHYGSVLRGTATKRISTEKKYDSENLEDALEEAKKLKSKVQLHLSGTPYRILMGSEFSDEDIICFCQYTDIINARDNWFSDNLDGKEDTEEKKEEWENPYFGFPQMIRFAFNLNSSSLRKIAELRESGITTTFSELFAPVSVNKDEMGEHRLFKHPKEVLDFLKAIDNSQEGEKILGFLNNKRIKEGNLCRHIVMVLPYRASCDAMEALIKCHVSEFDNLSEYKILNIVGHEQNGLFRNDRDVVQEIAKCEAVDQKTLTLTVNRMMTGSTVAEWDTMIYLKDTSSPQEYDQAIFRLQNPYIQIYKSEDGKVFKRNMKPQTLLVDFDPDRMFFLQELRAHIYDINTDANGNRNLLERIEKELKVSPVIWLNKDKLQKVTPNDILNFIRQYSSERSVLDEAMDIPVDRSLLDIEALREEIMRQQPIGSRGGLKMKPTQEEGEDDIDIGDVDTPQIDDGDSTTGNKKKDEDDSYEKRLATLYSRILFFAFLTKERVMSLQDILNVIDSNQNHKRIANHLSISKATLKLLFKHLNPNVLRELDYKIQNINDLANDESKTPIERVENAMKKFGRWSESEVVTPIDLARKMLSQIPRERIAADAKFLDIASKEGEFASAIIQEFGDTYKDKIYSIPTSSIAYEFTRRVYEALEMPVENIKTKYKSIEYNSYDLIGPRGEEIINELKNMGITVAVGNPPYQDEGGSGGTNDAPIYQEFCNVAKTLHTEFSTMVIPSKWFTGGREHLLGAFRKEMLTCGEISKMSAYTNAGDVFPNVEIKGGICHFLRDALHKGKCEYSIKRGSIESRAMRDLNENDVLIREPQLSQIVTKVLKKSKLDGCDFVEHYISSDTPFGIPTNPTSSKKASFVVKDECSEEFNTKLFYLNGSVRKVGYIRKSDVRKNKEDIDAIKVFIPKAYGASEKFPHQILGIPEYGGGNSVCSQTYLYIKFGTETEAKNFISYLKTRFFRLLVSSMKITQDAMSGVYHFVPMQDFSHPWTDEDLYKKYDLSPDDVNYIKSMIKPMATEPEEFMFD